MQDLGTREVAPPLQRSFPAGTPARSPWHMIACGASSVLGPALLADQRHEQNLAEILLLEFRLASAADFQQLLFALFRSNRDDEAATDRELLLQSRRHIGPASRH